MSEIEIAILTGSFTLLGIFSGAIFEFQREKWRDEKDQENKKQEMQQILKNAFLSPLCYYVERNNLHVLQYCQNYQTLERKVCDTLDSNVTQSRNY